MPSKYFILILTLFGPFSLHAKSVIFCIEEIDYLPYISLQDHKNNKVDGLLIKVVKQASLKVGIQAKFTRQPWLRCQAMVKNGQVQSLMAMIKNTDREKFFAFPKDVFYIQQVEYPIIVKRNGVFDDNNQLKPNFFDENQLFDPQLYKKHNYLGLDAPLGYISYQYLAANKILPPFHTSLATGLNLVVHEKLDGYVVERLIAHHEILKAGLTKQLTVTQGIVMKSYWYVPFNKEFYKRNRNKVNRFWQVVSDLGSQVLTDFSETKVIIDTGLLKTQGQ
ncbi:transporter substrate-binding domain-containing protein [Paraglaciecola aquimarina]|uniref:Transporter substrate-binding domain-containing protein n=1 Tax=Paraglaciecola algarum TaxID=3050085 RepID=A0ABS9D627_9ALTE|nr:transporter substrate-binding domain-containing protein [Paraglaciecola sp. G1-23]MCF2948235.1 transporter substrate-binding domain-containing protein [Paraglaciecola sp. G1-23]